MIIDSEMDNLPVIFQGVLELVCAFKSPPGKCCPTWLTNLIQTNFTHREERREKREERREKREERREKKREEKREKGRRESRENERRNERIRE